MILFRLSAVVTWSSRFLLLVAEIVHGDGSVRGTDRHVAEGGVKRFKQLLAQPFPCFHRQIGIVRNVLNSMEIRDLAVEHVAHEEMPGQPNPAERCEGVHGGGSVHVLVLGDGCAASRPIGVPGLPR